MDKKNLSTTLLTWALTLSILISASAIAELVYRLTST
jgi:hypothetical protein